MKITCDELKRLIHYNPDTGIFSWIADPFKGRKRSGNEAGHVGRFGYRLIKIGQFKYPAHRLAALYMDGQPPINEIDHINGERSDNRWANLRHATRKQNQENKCNHDMRGIRWDRNAWLVRIKHHGKTIYLGRTRDLEKAKEMRIEAELQYFTHSPACAPQLGSPLSVARQDGKQSDIP